jgi:hypothetical protein
MKNYRLFSLLVSSLILALPVRSFAHCDTLDGPVVVDAQAAFAAGDVTPVLKWVKADHEAEIRTAFTEALAVRKLSPAAAALADRFFFETLVRIHRAGEGAPYTGLKPAGSGDAALVAADRAIADGKIDALVNEVTTKVDRLLRARYAQLERTREHRDHHVAAGREFVAAYVNFIHLYENLAGLSDAPAHSDAHSHE